jgi:hypothetical protein
MTATIAHSKVTLLGFATLSSHFFLASSFLSLWCCTVFGLVLREPQAYRHIALVERDAGVRCNVVLTNPHQIP